ncbi:uncharacterized protein [Macrobrachium rosenbergii]|uniref:uncharacterized protein isoform X2 n=1 Tax=Macrobrachium rosenbergii TaxID=79674 RepID=UPI0034D61139
MLLFGLSVMEEEVIGLRCRGFGNEWASSDEYVCLVSVPTCSCIASCSRSFESDLESPATYVGCVDLYRTHAISFLVSCYLLDFP